MVITASEARRGLVALIEQVNRQESPIQITSRAGDAVLVSRRHYEALQEAAGLLRAARRVRGVLERLDRPLAGHGRPVADRPSRGDDSAARRPSDPPTSPPARG